MPAAHRTAATAAVVATAIGGALAHGGTATGAATHPLAKIKGDTEPYVDLYYDKRSRTVDGVFVLSGRCHRVGLAAAGAWRRAGDRLGVDVAPDGAFHLRRPVFLDGPFRGRLEVQGTVTRIDGRLAARGRVRMLSADRCLSRWRPFRSTWRRPD